MTDATITCSCCAIPYPEGWPAGGCHNCGHQQPRALGEEPAAAGTAEPAPGRRRRSPHRPGAGA